jgi:LPXTG-site transpeptidase (sortase) family protein
VRSLWLLALLLASALSLAGCAGAAEELIGTGTGPRVTGEPSGPSSTTSALTREAAKPTRPAPAPTAPTGLPASKPVRVDIPALDIAQRTTELGMAADGTIQVPVGPEPIGWFAESPTPGEIGPAVLAGHLTWNGADGVFRHLATLQRGDEIVVTRADGSRPQFVVTEVAQYPKDEFPTARVYANTPGPQLRLITCAGDYNPVSHNYSDNVVVYASMQFA